MTTTAVSPIAMLTQSELEYYAPKPGGYSEGGIYVDTKGVQWMVKMYTVPGHAKNEYLAYKLYKKAGIPVPEFKLVVFNSTCAIVSKMIENIGRVTESDYPKLWPGFAVDAWLAHWDVVGIHRMDNVLKDTKTGTVYRIDLGGAIDYGGVGGSKSLPPTVSDWDTMLDPKINQSTAKVFGAMSPKQRLDSLAHLERISDKYIRDTVMHITGKSQLADILIQRKNNLLLHQVSNNLVAHDPDMAKILCDLSGPEKDVQTLFAKTFYKQIKYLDTLPVKFVNALKTYTGTSYATVNTVLRADETAILGQKMSVSDTISTVDEIFRNVPPLQHDIVLWRGIRMKPKVLENFTEPAYISTSFNQDVAYEFVDKEYRCCVFQIRVPKGTHVIPLYTCSNAFFEEEVLLPRGGRITFAKSDNTVMHYKEHLPTKEFAIEIERGYTLTHNGLIVEDEKGGQWRLQPLDKMLNDNEYLGYKLYTLFNVNVTDMKRVKIDGKCYLVKKYDAGVTRPDDYAKARLDFIIDALLANPSVVKNMYTNSKGDFTRDELGIRVFDENTPLSTDDIPELKSMATLEPFKGVGQHDVEAGLDKIRRVTRSDIKKAVGGDTHKVNVLMKRIESILSVARLHDF